MSQHIQSEGLSEQKANKMDQVDIDLVKLSDYLHEHVGGFSGPLTAQKFPDGQSNPSYLLTAGREQYVLRRKPFGALLKSAHAVDREFRVISALAETDVPVAQGVHLCSDDSVIGAMFYLMSYEPGRIFWNPSLKEIAHSERRAYYEAMVSALAAVHNVDLTATQLEDYGRAGNYFERQFSRWSKQYRSSETEAVSAMDQLISWLGSNLPEEDGKTTLIHGDFRLDNMIFYQDVPKVRALLDWELSTLGHPSADIAYFCMCLRLPADGIIPGLQGLDRQALGLPSEEAILALYAQKSGGDPCDAWAFKLAFCYFRLAAIAQGVRKRALDGNASSQQAEYVGRMVQPLAEAALGVINEYSSARKQ